VTRERENHPIERNSERDAGILIYQTEKNRKADEERAVGPGGLNVGKYDDRGKINQEVGDEGE
jgi:hypothetical protein